MSTDLTGTAPAAPAAPAATAGAPGGADAPAPVRQDGAATRAAIVRAARHLLARHAHGDITLKAIAARAGVSAPLVVKYFGGRDALLAGVMSFESDVAELLDAPTADLGRHMVRHVLTGQAEHGADPILRIVFAPLHGEQGDILRANFRSHVTERLAARLDGDDSPLRAELAVSLLLGLGAMYGIARGPHVRDAAIDDVVERYAPAVQAQLTP
ncbi:TetR family transcriptional regulator [Streptomyces sp. Z26]|uniref:TetR/AcrR family transcriptional regulator n=1 Tax=Streptomyces sp. Z26 TaxID=2500177 RepID=UPI000EF14ECB|nr:TetR family transcriptional regulator [Streptomyces sp. Z26]RLL69780.1 TetR/AcrR family transcriptional regulator [Streptomyces sp. Z26]